jgi:hypothetical protein
MTISDRLIKYDAEEEALFELMKPFMRVLAWFHYESGPFDPNKKFLGLSTGYEVGSYPDGSGCVTFHFDYFGNHKVHNVPIELLDLTVEGFIKKLGWQQWRWDSRRNYWGYG